MQLMMYLQNDLVEAVPLESTEIAVPGYLGKIKRELKEKHKALLQNTPEQPEFLVVHNFEETSRTT